MFLTWFLSVLSVTYSVASSNSLESSGVVPEGVRAEYVKSGSTGQKGQMTAGNSTDLLLYDWSGICIDSVCLSMRSNTSSGAGSLCMRIGDELVWIIEDTDFAHVNWNGSFTTGWVDITQSIGQTVGVGQDVNIHIEASKNSLYINSYTIYYTIPEPVTHYVKFISGVGQDPPILTEESPQMGIVLPELCDTMPWYFLGWSESEVLEQDSCPKLFIGGSRYYPQTDCCLWAVYADKKSGIPATKAVSGEYVIVDAFWQRALSSEVVDGCIATQSVGLEEEDAYYYLVSAIDADMVYRVEIEGELLTITHNATQKSVGFDGELATKASMWHYRILDDGTWCIYFEEEEGHKVLYLGYGADGMEDDIVAYAAAINLDKMTRNALRLYPHVQKHYTTWPFGKFDAVESVKKPELIEKNTEYIIYFGNYELRVRNGNKYLHLHR